MTKKNGSSGGEEGVGYGRPPKSGQIKPGEVRNPWGKTGTPRLTDDVLLKVASELVPANVNGRATMISQEEGLWRKVFQEIHKGKIPAARLAAESLERLRPPRPPHPTMEEIEKQEAEQARRKELTARIVATLEEMAALKGSGFDLDRYRADFRAGKLHARPVPLHDSSAVGPTSPGAGDKPVEEPGG